MIDRRHLVLGGLAGLIVPCDISAQIRPGAAGPAPSAPLGNAGADRTRAQSNDRNETATATQQANQGIQQPARIQALVLSQSYQAIPRLALANTTRDAVLIARSFQQLRFDRVAVHSDGTPADTIANILAYLAGVDANTIALIYVAGHGIEIAGENLLVLEGGSAFLSLQALVQVLQQRAGVTILFLDACRTNPFGSLAAGARISRAISLGPNDGVQLQTVGLDDLRAASAGSAARLAAFSLQGSGIRIVFSTDPANIAFDGARPSSRNSPFAQALARRIREPLSLDDIVSLTTGDVIRATRRVQSPWSQGSIDRPIFLSGRRRRQQGNLR